MMFIKVLFRSQNISQGIVIGIEKKKSVRNLNLISYFVWLTVNGIEINSKFYLVRGK